MKPPPRLPSAPAPASVPRKSEPLRPTAREPVSAEQVKEFIRAHEASAPPVSPVLQGVAELPLTNELAGAVTQLQDKEKAQLPTPVVPAEAVIDPDMAGQAALRESALGAQDVELDQDDKDAYVQATLADQAMVLVIRLAGGAAFVRVRTLTVMHEDIIAWWLSSLEKDQTITTTAKWLAMFQRANILLRVLDVADNKGGVVATFSCQAVENEVAECAKYKDELSMDTDGRIKGIGIAIPEDMRKKAVLALASHINNVYRGMSLARYSLLQSAVAQHEKKFNMLTRLAASGNF